MSDEVCVVHATHSPIPKVTHHHHVIPQAWGGQSIPSNMVTVCPTGHYNIHHLIDAYVKAGGRPSWDVEQHYGEAERVLAERAWRGRPNDHPPLTVRDL